MSKIINKFIGSGELVQDAINNGELLKAPSQNSVFDALALKIASSEKGANSGVATLDSGGKIPVGQLPNSVMELQGAWNASTNSPSLADGTGNAGDFYLVTTAGSQNLGSGSITYAVDDYVFYGADAIWHKSHSGADSVASVFGRTGIVVSANGDYTASQIANVPAGNIAAVTVQAALDELDSDKASTGYADALVSNTAYAGSWNGVTGIAPSKDAVYDQMELKLNSSAFTDAAVTGKLITGYTSGAGTVAGTDTILEAIQKLNGNIAALPGSSSYGKEVITLSGGDITNQYVDMLEVIKANSLQLFVAGVHQVEGASYDYTISLTGGAGGKTRLSFVNGLATGGDYALIAGDKLAISYVY